MRQIEDAQKKREKNSCNSYFFNLFFLGRGVRGGGLLEGKIKWFSRHNF